MLPGDPGLERRELVRMADAELPFVAAVPSVRPGDLSAFVQGLEPDAILAPDAASRHIKPGTKVEILNNQLVTGRSYYFFALGIFLIIFWLVRNAFSTAGFDANAIQPDAPLQIYAAQRHVFDVVLARGMAGGDDPAIVAKAIVAAATDPKPVMIQIMPRRLLMRVSNATV